MLEKYINLLKINHIDKYAKSMGYKLTNEELNFIYNKVKYNYKELINNPDNIFNEAKSILRSDVYNKIIELYNQYKKKLDSYL